MNCHEGTSIAQSIGLMESLRAYFCPFDGLAHTGRLMLCAGGRMRQCHQGICAWMADYFENIHLHSINQPHCPVSEAPKSSFGEGNSLWWNWETIGYISKRWYLRLWVIRLWDRKQDNIRKMQRLEPQKLSSGIWNTSLQSLLQYPIFLIPSISVCLSMWWTG